MIELKDINHAEWHEFKVRCPEVRLLFNQQVDRISKLHESNNRQSDIIYDLKVQRDEMLEFLNCIITRYDNDDSVSGIYLDKVRAYLPRIKGGK